MKKILFATTALVATASVAAADVTFSGYARVGIQRSADSVSTAAVSSLNTETGAIDTVAAGTVTPAATTMDHRIQLGVSGSAEADNGTTFSVYSRMRVDDSEASDGFNTPTITISNGAFKLQAGNTYSAIGARTNVFGSGTGLNADFGIYDRTDTWYSSGGAAGMDRIRVDYTMGSTTLSVSGDVSGADALEVGLSAALGSLNVGVGASDDSRYTADVNFALGDVTVGARITDTLSGAYANYTQGDLGLQMYAADDNDWGVGMTYALGGGATFGAEYNETGAMNATIGFNF
ncbi:porin [Lentibacter sp.]|uniref:porin n=1 Tax=Lentibacter sp. TaxID=2024994 RepID=UPI0032D97FDA